MARIAPAGRIQQASRIGQQVGAKRRPVPTQPKIDVQQRTKEAQEKFVKEETAKANALIDEYQQNIKLLSAKQKALEGGNRGKFNELENDKAFYKRQIRGIAQGKKSISQGARFEDVTSFAVAKASAELANIAAQTAADQAELQKEIDLGLGYGFTQKEAEIIAKANIAARKDTSVYRRTLAATSPSVSAFREEMKGKTIKTSPTPTQPDYSFSPSTTQPSYSFEPTMYAKPIPAYYDPKTGEKIFQSIEPSYVEERGLKSFDLIGEQGDKYIAEEKGGFLTERQTKTKDILERDAGSGFIFGVSPTTQIQSTETPTQFLIDKPGAFAPTGTTQPTLTDLGIVPPTKTTTYDVAAKQTPFYTPYVAPTTREKIGGVLQWPEAKFREFTGIISADPQFDIVGKRGIIAPVTLSTRTSETIKASLGLTARPDAPRVMGGGTVLDIGTFVLPGVAPVRAATFTSYVAGKTTAEGVEYIKEEPLEFTAGVLIGGGYALKGVKAFKAAQVSKYTSKPDLKIVSSVDDLTKNVIKEPTIKLRLETGTRDSLAKTSLIPKKKGLTTTTELFPRGTARGKVLELRKTSVFRKAKTLEGDIFLPKEGGFKEILPYGKKITRVTEVDPTGRGTLRVLKGRRTLIKKKIKPSDSFDDILELTKSSTQKRVYDKQFDQPLTITKGEIQAPTGKKASVFKATDEAGTEFVGEGIGKLAKSKKVTGELKITTKGGSAPGRTRVVQEKTGFSDIIEVGARKAQAQVKSPSGRVTIQQRVGQKIEFGMDKSFDKVMTRTTKDVFKQQKQISPTVNRQITDVSGRQFLDITLKPGSRTERTARLIEKAKLKSKIDFAKKADTYQEAVMQNELIQAASMSKPITAPVSGQGSQLILDPSKQSLLQKLSSKTYVPKTSTFLKKRPFTPLPKSFTPTIRAAGKVTTAPTTILGAITKQGSLYGQASKPETSQAIKQSQEFNQIFKTTTKLDQKVDTKTKQKTKQSTKSVSAMALPLKPLPINETLTARGGVRPYGTRLPPVVPFLPSKAKPTPGKKTRAYDAQVYTRAGWKNVNTRPLGKAAAISKGAKVVDKSPAINFRIVPSRMQGKVSRGTDNYYNRTRHKYRSSKIVRGVLDSPEHLTWYEKKAYRKDSPSERPKPKKNNQFAPSYNFGATTRRLTAKRRPVAKKKKVVKRKPQTRRKKR